VSGRIPLLKLSICLENPFLNSKTKASLLATILLLVLGTSALGITFLFLESVIFQQ
jgi:hypothetical protein